MTDTKLSRIEKHVTAGELIEASVLVSDWLALAPDDADAATAQARLLRLFGRYQEAQAWLDRAFAVAPAHGPACVEAARLAAHLGEPGRALDWFERAHRAMPDETSWLGEWAVAAHQKQESRIGVAVAKLWCEAAPEAADAWFTLGLMHQQAGAYDASLEAYRRAMALNPDVPMLRNNIAALHYSLGHYELALTTGMEAIRSEPGNHLAWTNLANTWLLAREPAKALLAARRAATLAPNFGLAQLARSNAARESQQWDEAFEAIVQAATVAGADPQIQFSVAMLQLMQGDFRNGWINFEARWLGSPELKAAPAFCPERRWRGEALSGRTLLVWGEQGHGDAIQFIRFLPLLAKQARNVGGTVVVCCFPPLFELFERSLVGHGVTVLRSDISELPAFDFQIPLASLPLMLGITLESLPAPASYLSADAASMTCWRDRMAGSGALKVGLVWTGSLTHQRNPLRAVTPEHYAGTFAELPGVEFHSLQVDAADDAVRMIAAGLRIVDRTSELGTFDNTAALICNLDLVITVCTSVAHLAAALGRPTWLLLDVNPHWVWMTGRRDSPWYPTVTLYRQRSYRDWTAPLRELRADLERLISARATGDNCAQKSLYQNAPQVIDLYRVASE
jgi:tetratricopeptide (TPR) repeat protein